MFINNENFLEYLRTIFKAVTLVNIILALFNALFL